MIIYLLFFLLALPLPALAQTPTIPPSSQPLEEIQRIREAIQEKVKEKLTEIQEPVSFKKGIIGQITQVNVPTSLEINFNGETSSILLDPEVVYINSKKNKSGLQTLKVGDEVLALGVYEPITQQLTAKRLIAFSLEKDLTPLPQTMFGTVTDISESSQNSVFISLTPVNDKNQQLQIATDANTKYFDSNYKAVTSPKLTIGQKVIIIAQKGQASSWKAQKIVIRSPLTPPSPTSKPAN